MKKQRALVIGMKISGSAAARFLLSKGYEVIGVDRNEVDLTRFKDAPHFSFKKQSEVPSCEGIDLTVISPGVDPRLHPLVLDADRRGIPVLSEIELGMKFLSQRCVGITGSNGKSTCTALTAHVLRENGIQARAVGNIGTALTEVLLDASPDEILVIELSSFQLEMTKTPKLEVAVVLNLSQDHLDRYSSMQEYAVAKARIVQLLVPGGVLYLNSMLEESYPDLFRCREDKQLFNKEEGINETALVASMLASHFGVSQEGFLKAYESYQPLQHRLELVAEIGGVKVYNDSKATNVAAVLFAVKQFTQPIILLAGGKDKGISYTSWKQFSCKVKKIVLFGQAAERMKGELEESFRIEQCASLSEALEIGLLSAEAGDVLLFSPGCSSFDQFINFEQRGEIFKQLVHKWKECGSISEFKEIDSCRGGL